MCFDYEYNNEFQSSAVQKARKVHKCDCCRCAIAIGSHYLYESGKCEGDLFTVKTCRRCLYDIARIVAHEHLEGCTGQEAWPSVDDVGDYLIETEWGGGRTAIENVPTDFDVKRDWPYGIIDRLETQMEEAAK